MFEACKREIQELRNENNELRSENKGLQKSKEFYYEQNIDLKKQCLVMKL